MLVIRKKKCRITDVLVLGTFIFRLRQVRVILTFFSALSFRGVAVVRRRVNISTAPSHNVKMQRKQQQKTFCREKLSLKVSVVLDVSPRIGDGKRELRDANECRT
jgi:hypothetical protein